ncbi:cell division protein FtsI / penicillin-binding protein [Campylobacter blaseri]|uniref:Penicillin-binding protein n=1 Tax=Campylobacter blaseri TaxID=2042961 RepID=A0A2P8R067_9BACT|nr:penicillin-binding protein 2 [Campylobacter blaseri]PSM51884.1 penicillin-binding protein [Campylobacter blaseri]PSM53668.1 penicillin-binding protein [Campylobacter blaseri]QKF85779.1 cell division protein FtsI / penicillin-binding protein [Campylobacter blaseri]
MHKNKDTRLSAIIIFMLIVPLLLSLFILAAYYWANTDRNLPTLQLKKENLSIRGDIISQDGFILAHSKKLHKITVDTRSIDINKLDMFINLYSIYTGEDKQKIKNLLSKKNGSVVLSFNADTKTAENLKSLSRKLNQKKVFMPFKVRNGIYSPAIDIDIIQSGENRNYIANDSLSPILGYVKKEEINNITRTQGVKGVEKFYDYYLSDYKNDEIKGYRDIGNNIILDKSSLLNKKESGFNIILNIPIKLQKRIELLLSQKAKQYDAKEIILGIIESKTGKVLSLVSSQRYNPSKITKKDYHALNSSAIEYIYEPGSVIKPIVFSIIYEAGKVKPNDIINTHNGVFRLGRQTIKDTHPKKEMSAEDIIVYSSNIGMAELSERIDGLSLAQGFNSFKISRHTNIDLPYEHQGNIRALNNKTHKISVSYGYAINTTFIQLLNAYTIFNNSGLISSPRVVNTLEKNGKYYEINKPNLEKAISPKTAEAVKEILINTVKRGTGRGAQTNGLIVGGKTGTAKVAQGGKYGDLYNSSFFGFANDANRSYTIGALVIEPKQGSYYASQTALPVFKEVINILIDEGYLTPAKSNEDIDIDKNDLENIID